MTRVLVLTLPLLQRKKQQAMDAIVEVRQGEIKDKSRTICTVESLLAFDLISRSAHRMLSCFCAFLCNVRYCYSAPRYCAKGCLYWSRVYCYDSCYILVCDAALTYAALMQGMLLLLLAHSVVRLHGTQCFGFAATSPFRMRGTDMELAATRRRGGESWKRQVSTGSARRNELRKATVSVQCVREMWLSGVDFALCFAYSAATVLSDIALWTPD